MLSVLGYLMSENQESTECNSSTRISITGIEKSFGLNLLQTEVCNNL